jgi:hypothetical protein
MIFLAWQVLLFMVLGAVGVSFLVESYLDYKDSSKKRTDTIERNDESKDKEPKDMRDITSRILFTRNFTGTSSSNEVTDALLDYISNIDTVAQLKYTSFYVMDTEEEFEVHPTHQITGQVSKIVLDDATGAVKLVSFYLQSYSLSITELRAWVNDVHSEYTVNKNNELGSRRYFFNQLPEKQVRGEKKANLSFDMSLFETTKTLDNLYGDHIDRVQNRIQLFQNKAWYQRNGVPHTLGILLYGEPGCGKTSLIKAIANDTNRHVFNIRLSDNMTKDQLSHLFFDPKVHVRNKETSNVQVITIPLNQRLYVLEDIDCAENTVLSRAFIAPAGPPSLKVPQFAEGMFGERELDMIKEQVNKEKEERIDLAFLLNILDGVLETPQRLMVMTTNYPSKLDAALLRPGRIDLILEFRKCSVEMLLIMVQNFYGDQVNTSPLLDDRLNGVLTPAEVQEVLCNYIEDSQGAVKQIKNLALNKLHQMPVLVYEPPPAAAQGVERAQEQEQPREQEQEEQQGATRLDVVIKEEEQCVPAAVCGGERKECLQEKCPQEKCPQEKCPQECGINNQRLQEQSTNVLPAADATPVRRRRPEWLKYQL